MNNPPKLSKVAEAVKSAPYGGLDPKRAELASAITKVLINDALRQVKAAKDQQGGSQ